MEPDTVLPTATEDTDSSTNSVSFEAADVMASPGRRGSKIAVRSRHGNRVWSDFLTWQELEEIAKAILDCAEAQKKIDLETIKIKLEERKASIADLEKQLALLSSAS